MEEIQKFLKKTITHKGLKYKPVHNGSDYPDCEKVCEFVFEGCGNVDCIEYNRDGNSIVRNCYYWVKVSD